MTLSELRTVYEEVLEKQKSKDILYQNYLYIKQNSLKKEELIKMLELGIMMYNQGEPKMAYSVFSEAINFETDADAFYNRGTVCMDLGELRHAIHDFTAAIIFCPTYSPPYRNRGLSVAQTLARNSALNDPKYLDIKNFAKSDLMKAAELGDTEVQKYIERLS